MGVGVERGSKGERGREREEGRERERERGREREGERERKGERGKRERGEGTLTFVWDMSFNTSVYCFIGQMGRERGRERVVVGCVCVCGRVREKV
jgi:hypothetical protein